MLRLPSAWADGMALTRYMAAPCCGYRAASTASSSTSEEQGGPKHGSSKPSSAASSSSSTTTTTTTTSKAMEDLAKASPTGRLLDLFGPGGELASTSAPTADPLAMRPKRQREAWDKTAVGQDMAKVILQAVENCKPLVRVQSINTGQRIIHVPKPVHPRQQESMSVRWIVAAAEKRREDSKNSDTAVFRPMAECLATELLLAFRKEGAAREKRDELHKLALENKNNVGGYRLK